MTRAKIYAVCQIYLTPLTNVDHSSRHYGHFVSGQQCALFKNSQKTIKCPNCFVTSCSYGQATFAFSLIPT